MVAEPQITVTMCEAPFACCDWKMVTPGVAVRDPRPEDVRLMCCYRKTRHDLDCPANLEHSLDLLIGYNTKGAYRLDSQI